MYRGGVVALAYPYTYFSLLERGYATLYNQRTTNPPQKKSPYYHTRMFYPLTTGKATKEKPSSQVGEDLGKARGFCCEMLPAYSNINNTWNRDKRKNSISFVS
jgi:hypothetical protein